MTANLLRSLWVLVVCATVGAAWLAIHLFGTHIGPWAAALIGVLVVGALHPAVIAGNFLMARIAGDPVPKALRLSLWQAIRTYDAEIDASMRGMWFATPFLPHRSAARPAPGAVLRPLPILFIHGYLCNRAIWLSFMRDAAAHGYVCEAVTLPNPLAAIDSQTDVVVRAIDELLATAAAAGLPATRVAIVAHSMGGLVARSTMRSIGTARIAHVVTLGTPHHGTRTARLGRAPSVVQMRRNSAWLAALAQTETTPATFTTLFSYHDDIVYPQQTAVLEGAHRIAIGGCGHVALVYDRRVREHVFERLATIESQRVATPTGLAS
ncbi:MAG: alpha/beta fold hydrolase [Burkholderiaceae bacterium]